MLDNVIDFFTGTDLSPETRVWSALAPALLLFAYFLVTFLLYLVRVALRGQAVDQDMKERGDTALLLMFFRYYFVWAMRPVWAIAFRLGVPPTAITSLAALFGIAAGVALAAGRFSLGGWLYIFAGIADVLDGRIARATEQVTEAGGALDAILDRYVDAAVLCGLAWFYRDSWVLAPTLVALVGSSLVPYVRARGEAAGVSVTVGVMQRAERILYLGVGCALSPILEAVLVPNDPKPIHRIAVMGIVMLAVATHLTALHRLMHVLAVLNGKKRDWFRQNRGPISRNIVAAMVATGADFAFFSVLVQVFMFAPPWATAMGCALGGAVNYSLNRFWTFRSKGAALPQMGRYTFVSFTSALLNSGGVAVLLLLPDIDYRIGWLVVRVAVFLAWNYPLQRDYVFDAQQKKEPATA